MLTIKNLHVTVDDKPILKGLNFAVNPGEVHAIMGPNGSGKSTLANVLAGHEGYAITNGSITYLNENLIDLSVEERSQKGVFLGFQYPVEISGISNIYLLKTALNTLRKARGQDEVDAIDFINLVKDKMKSMSMREELLYRSVNEGFSGGEKKRNEILQMMVLEPRLAVLDETDSGLDIDALKIVANGINSMRSKDNSFILITHYQRLLDFVKPDFVHVITDGNIIKSGGPELAHELEREGYGTLDESA